MLPIKSNITDKGCSPTSSNCVIWQGPNLSCINLCTGDSVSDVVYKLGLEVCDLQQQLDLSDLDITCLVDACQTCPEPSKTLSVILDLLLSKVCSLEDLTSNGSSQATYIEPTLVMETCFQYTNQSQVLITSALHSDYTKKIAEKVCALNTTLTNNTTQLNSLTSRVVVLENEADYVPPTVTLTSLTGSSTSLDLDDAITTVSTELVTLKEKLGSNSDIIVAASKQCTALGSSNALSQSGTMSSIQGWKTNTTTLSNSINNLWLTVCDMRASLISFMSSIDTTNCANVLIDFVATPNLARTQVTIILMGHVTIPSGFTNSTTNSKVTFKDSAGNKYEDTIDVISYSTNPSGKLFTLPGNINTALDYTITLDSYLTKAGVTCVKTAIVTLLAPCPVITSVSATIS